MDWANNTMYGFTNVSREIISINLVTGVGTRITSLSAFLNGVYGISADPVPEPGAFLLTGFGLIGIALWRNRLKAAPRITENDQSASATQ
jgi:hypothetical protein